MEKLINAIIGMVVNKDIYMVNIDEFSENSGCAYVTITTKKGFEYSLQIDKESKQYNFDICLIAFGESDLDNLCGGSLESCSIHQSKWSLPVETDENDIIEEILNQMDVKGAMHTFKFLRKVNSYILKCFEDEEVDVDLIKDILYAYSN